LPPTPPIPFSRWRWGGGTADRAGFSLPEGQNIQTTTSRTPATRRGPAKGGMVFPHAPCYAEPGHLLFAGSAEFYSQIGAFAPRPRPHVGPIYSAELKKPAFPGPGHRHSARDATRVVRGSLPASNPDGSRPQGHPPAGTRPRALNFGAIITHRGLGPRPTPDRRAAKIRRGRAAYIPRAYFRAGPLSRRVPGGGIHGSGFQGHEGPAAPAYGEGYFPGGGNALSPGNRGDTPPNPGRRRPPGQRRGRRSKNAALAGARAGADIMSKGGAMGAAGRRIGRAGALERGRIGCCRCSGTNVVPEGRVSGRTMGPRPSPHPPRGGGLVKRREWKQGLTATPVTGKIVGGTIRR